jgi:hypothetical protein
VNPVNVAVCVILAGLWEIIWHQTEYKNIFLFLIQILSHCPSYKICSFCVCGFRGTSVLQL